MKPNLLMVIDSTKFNGSQQFNEWYEDYQRIEVDGFPTDQQVRNFLNKIDVAITCELFYHTRFTEIARNMRVKTICIANPEFFDWFKPTWAMTPLPNEVIVPSYWMHEEMQQRFNARYLPTPIFSSEFKKAREVNFERTGKRRYLFMQGKAAVHDRNGLETLYAAMQLSKGKYEVVVKSQDEMNRHPDPRLVYDFSNPDNQEDLYKDFDALIMPRRYGGQCLPMSEALLSGLPVIMTDIDPNDKILPKAWLVPALKTGEFMTRKTIDIYSAKTHDLADLLDNFDNSKESKLWAYELGSQFDAENLREQYKELVE